MVETGKIVGVHLFHEWKPNFNSDEIRRSHKVYIVWDKKMDGNNRFGSMCEKLSFNPDNQMVQQIRPGDHVEVDWNRFNKPEYIKKIQ